MTQEKLKTINKSIFDWLSTDPKVQEESLTDWLKYQIIKKSTSNGTKVTCKLFSKQIEGSVTGADIELFVIKKGGTYAYRIQAKKLKNSATENAKAFTYPPNNSGNQYNMLINDASKNGMTPLYMFYTSISGNMKCNKYAQNCGAIISDATIYKVYASGRKKQCAASDIISMSYPLPCILCRKKKCNNPFNRHYQKNLPDYVIELLDTGTISNDAKLKAKSILIVDYR